MGKFNYRLAIAIPTYNRDEIFFENMQVMLPELKAYRIPIYISDDSSNCKTGDAVEKLREEYEYIYYRKNNPGLGHDSNFFATLAMSDCDYVWYVGDSVYLRPGCIFDVLKSLDSGADLIFVNSYANDSESRLIIDSLDVHNFLVDRVWYLTLTGATIYGRGPRNWVVAAAQKSSWCNFVQLGLILDYCGKNSASLYWHGVPSLGFNKKKKSYWMGSALKVFAADWVAFVRSFKYLFSENEVEYIIKSHAAHTKIFGLRRLFFLRAGGGLSFLTVKKYALDYAAASPSSVYFAYGVSLIPVLLASWILRIFYFLRGLVVKNKNFRET
jgi:hypothetical protein